MTGRNDEGKPGLLLVCHGDVPEALADDPECRRLYAECLIACGQMQDTHAAVPAQDVLSTFSEQVAASLSSRAGGPVELAFMGFPKPGIREAMYRITSAGARTVVCVGAGGLMLPGSGATVHLPAAVGQVLETNPGLDVFYARPEANPHVTSALIMASVEDALAGPGIAPRPSGDIPEIGGDTGVIVVSSSRQATTSAAGARQCVSLHAAIARLSDYSRARAGDPDAGVNLFMSEVAACLASSGIFCDVQAGCLDFSGPDLDGAASRLVQAGARRIIATGMPLLMHRHLLSYSDPSEALARVKKELPGRSRGCPADIIYVSPEGGTVAQAVGGMLQLKVLDALARGETIGPARPRRTTFS